MKNYRYQAGNLATVLWVGASIALAAAIPAMLIGEGFHAAAVGIGFAATAELSEIRRLLLRMWLRIPPPPPTGT